MVGRGMALRQEQQSPVQLSSNGDVQMPGSDTKLSQTAGRHKTQRPGRPPEGTNMNILSFRHHVQHVHSVRDFMPTWDSTSPRQYDVQKDPKGHAKGTCAPFGSWSVPHHPGPGPEPVVHTKLTETHLVNPLRQLFADYKLLL